MPKAVMDAVSVQSKVEEALEAVGRMGVARSGDEVRSLIEQVAVKLIELQRDAREAEVRARVDAELAAMDLTGSIPYKA